MEAKYAFYPAGTEHIRLTIRHKGDSTVYFGSDYTVCRFQHGRWETLPVVNAWNSLLTGIGPNNLSRTEVPHPAPAAEYTYGFTARLAPVSTRPGMRVTVSANRCTRPAHTVHTCSRPSSR